MTRVRIAPKMTTFASTGGLGLLQIVLESVIGRCEAVVGIRLTLSIVDILKL